MTQSFAIPLAAVLDPAAPTPPLLGSAAQSFPAAAEQFAAAFAQSVSVGVDGIVHIGDMASDIVAALASPAENWSEVLSTWSWTCLVAGIMAIILRFWLGRHIADELRPDFIGRCRMVAARFIANIISLGVFLLVARWLMHNEAATPAVAAVWSAVWNMMCGVALTAFLAEMLFGPAAHDVGLISIDHPRYHALLLAIYGALTTFAGQIVTLSAKTAADSQGTNGWFFASLLFLTILKGLWFALGRRDIANAFAGRNASRFRRMAASAIPVYYLLSAVLLGMVGCIAVDQPNKGSWALAAGATQFIILLMPVIALGSHGVVEGVLTRLAAKTALSPAQEASGQAVTLLLAGGAVLLGLRIILFLWTPIMTNGTASSTLRAIEASERLAFSFIICGAVWRFFRRYFKRLNANAPAHLPGELDDLSGLAAPTRFATILPLLRYFTFAALLFVCLLAVLLSFNINTAPLLAGFGILGLGLSFGSQALVKDIVSGIFFLADDAFRIGEYVDTGKLKGSVERISLRSIQLRHQNGPLHTVPFGQLEAITNFSRDWSTTKFEMRFERDMDPERIRKVVKKVGQDMLADEEIGQEFLLPLKMQGIQDVTDTSIVVRLKFTAKPGNPSVIQREAIKRLLPALRAENLVLSSNAVTVRSGVTDSAAGAALIANQELRTPAASTP